MKMICVRKEPWKVDPPCKQEDDIPFGPKYLEEVIVNTVDTHARFNGEICTWYMIDGFGIQWFGARNFRPKEPDLDELRKLLEPLKELIE